MSDRKEDLRRQDVAVTPTPRRGNQDLGEQSSSRKLVSIVKRGKEMESADTWHAKLSEGCPIRQDYKRRMLILYTEAGKKDVLEVFRTFQEQHNWQWNQVTNDISCLLYTSPSPRDKRQSRMPSSA